jgi:dihydroflavonol-4-reductase
MTITTLVTGAAGHIGFTLVRCLLEQGRRVRALVRRDCRRLEDLGVEIVQADIRDETSLRPAFRDVDVVYHLASHISIRTDEWPVLHATNVEGVRNVVRLCKEYGVRRLVHFSSLEAFEPAPLSSPVDETRALLADDFFLPYPRSKAAGHRVILEALNDGLDAVIICPGGVLGPNDYTFRAGNAFLLQLANRELPSLVVGGYDWVDVRDVVEGTIQAEQRAVSGAVYILSNRWASTQALALMMRDAGGIPVPPFCVPLWFAYLLIPPMNVLAYLQQKPSLVTRAALYALSSNRNISHQRATHDLGYQPRPLQATVADSLAWFREAGFLKARQTG